MEANKVIKKLAPYGYLVASLYFFLYAGNSLAILFKSKYYDLLPTRANYYSHVMVLAMVVFYFLMFLGLVTRRRLFYWINALLMIVILLTFPFGSLLFPGWVVFASGVAIVLNRNWFLRSEERGLLPE